MDDNCNIGIFVYGGVGAGLGLGCSASLSVSILIADQINDIEGLSLSAGIWAGIPLAGFGIEANVGFSDGEFDSRDIVAGGVNGAIPGTGPALGGGAYIEAGNTAFLFKGNVKDILALVQNSEFANQFVNLGFSKNALYTLINYGLSEVGYTSPKPYSIEVGTFQSSFIDVRELERNR